MPRYDFNKPRLFAGQPLAAGVRLNLPREQVNYLRNVLRLSSGDEVLVFNGVDGEWMAQIVADGRKTCLLDVAAQSRAQTPPADIQFLFAPLKHARLDYMMQKATEMGASHILPVITRRTQVKRVNIGRIRANVIEAAEQCGILNIPAVDDARPLQALLASWPVGRSLIFCDEDEPVGDPVAVLRRKHAIGSWPAPIALLIGPEGGFDAEERAAIKAIPEVVTIALGPRILRADTAAVAALTIVQAALGDWHS